VSLNNQRGFLERTGSALLKLAAAIGIAYAGSKVLDSMLDISGCYDEKVEGEAPPRNSTYVTLNEDEFQVV
jgi:hypothetical protein